MQFSSGIIDDFISSIQETTLLSKTCRLIKAYEGGNLPVPIKNIYFSFSSEETKITYSYDENGDKIETGNYVIRMNCFVPLTSSPASAHTLAESVMLYLALSNTDITGFSSGKTDYDSDVDAYRITCRIYLGKSEKADTETQTA